MTQKKKHNFREGDWRMKDIRSEMCLEGGESLKRKKRNDLIGEKDAMWKLTQQSISFWADIYLILSMCHAQFSVIL